MMASVSNLVPRLIFNRSISSATEHESSGISFKLLDQTPLQLYRERIIQREGERVRGLFKGGDNFKYFILRGRLFEGGD